jgi:hypothetical protein
MTDGKAEPTLTPTDLYQAFEQTRPEFAAMSKCDLLPLNLDPVAAAGRVRAALRNVDSLRAEIAESFPHFDFNQLATLERYTLALIHAQRLVVCAKSPPTRLRALHKEGIALRAGFTADIEGLARRGHVRGIRNHTLRGTTSYRDIASDLNSLVALLRQDWAIVSAKTGVTEAELVRAETIANELILSLGSRERMPEQLERATLDRQKAFTLCARAYESLRQTVLFLRWSHKDGKNYVPSLYGKRKAKKQRVTDAPVEEPVGVPDGLMKTELPTESHAPTADPFEN